MKRDPKATNEYAQFQTALRTVLKVSKSDLDQMVADSEKARHETKGKPGPKPRHSSTSGHASDSTDSD